METKKLKLTFWGGAGSVTGANFLLENESLKILVDCGFVQGGKTSHDENRKAFPYNPATIDILLVTHAHLDHVGKIPKLVKDGFRGKIYWTLETKMLAELIMTDSASLLLRESQQDNETVLYTEYDVETALSLWEPVPYHTVKDISSGFQIYLKDAGHILGSTMFEVRYSGKKIVFTGDLGNSPSPLLKDTEVVSDADYMVMESVYGDRNHEPRDERERRFISVVKETVAKRGVLVIPAFSIERTQVILYELNNLIQDGKLGFVPVFLDSPLAIKVTRVYKERAMKDFNEEVKKIIADGDDIFNFPNLHFTLSTEESKKILNFPSPKIIIAGSGMSSGGRILHHEKNYLPDGRNTLLLMGYEAAGTLGRQLQDGAKNVSIYGDEVEVRAKIEMISGYSSHKDSDHLIDFVADTKDTVKTVFTAMGEPKSSLFLVQRLRDYLGVNAVFPEQGKTYELEV